MDFIFDTGSAIVYMVSDTCKSCPQKSKFVKDKSKSFVEQKGAQFHQAYGIGSIAGQGASDTFCFSEKEYCVPEIHFIEVDQGTDMEVDQFSGLIGLAPDGESSDMKTFLDQIDNGGNPATNSLTVKNTKPIDAIFSIYLSQG